MRPENQDSIQSKLKQLWGGGQVPPLTEEQTEWALLLWKKIKALQAREEKMNAKGSAECSLA